MNEGYTYTERIGGGFAGRALLAHLSSRFGHSSQAQWRERIEEGAVLVDGARARADDRLWAGQVVAWKRPPWTEPPAPLIYAVLAEDPHLVAVAKPSGLPTLPGGGFLQNTLLGLVRRRYPGASPLHRLGRGTSGVVLLARSSEAAAAVAKAWREHRILKIYRALVEGEPAGDAFAVMCPIGPVPHPKLTSVHAACAKGKAARSEVRVLERGGTTSLVEVRIETGRPHQIRIHMAACGHPLAGDPLYAPGGGLREGGGALPGDVGYLLHAQRLCYTHPATGEAVSVECPPPRALRTSAELFQVQKG